MSSEHFKCKEEPSINYIEEDGIEPTACEPYFVDIHDILNREIKEEATEDKPSSEYGVSNENRKLYDTNPDSSEFEVMLRDSVEDPTESKFSPTDFWKNRNLNDPADELAKFNFNHYNGVILKKEDEDHSERNYDSLTNNVELKPEALKTEDDVDIIYKDEKPEMCGEKSIGNTDILIGSEIGRNFSHEQLSKDSETWPEQNIKEDGTAVERDNNTRKEPTVTIDSKIENIPHSEYYSNIHSFESKRELNETSLVQLERIHTDENPYQCKICYKVFAQKFYVKHHEKIHTGDKQFHCKICPKSFVGQSGLMAHERVHTGEKPFQCKICSNNFTVKSSLLEHERIHTGEKPFQCKICPRNYTRRGSLLQHERSHTGEKLFHCQVCSKSFAIKKSLLLHERIHTERIQMIQY